MTSNVDTVLFAIQAGLRLYAAGKRAYVEKALASPTPLPLPSGVTVNRASARRWFRGETGKAVVELNERIAALVNKTSLSAAEEAEIVELYVAAFLQYEPELPDEFRLASGPRLDEVQTFLTVRQWSAMEAARKVTALQRIGGTLVNVAVDYFLQTPGALSDKKPEGRALRAFLQAIDTRDFANTPVETLAGDLLIAIVEAVKGEPSLIGRGETTERIVRNITESLASSAKNYLKDLPTGGQREGGQWLQMIAHAMVRGASEAALSNPQKILRVGGAEGAVIREIGGTVADLLLGGDAGRRLNFQRLFSGDGLEIVTRASLKAVTNNPDVLKIGNEGLKKVLVEVAGTLESVRDPFAEDMFPELVRLILERSSGNLALLWGADETDPKKHLLLVAASGLLRELSRKPAAGRWKPTLTRGQALTVAEAVFDEVIDNPYWVEKIQGVGGAEDTPVGVAVGAVLESFAKAAGRRFNNETVVAALKTGMKTGAMEISLLEKVPQGAAGEARTALTAALDAVFEGILGNGSDAKSRWRQASNLAVQAAVEVVLAKFAEAAAKNGVRASQFAAIRAKIRHWMDQNPLVEEVARQIREDLLAA